MRQQVTKSDYVRLTDEELVHRYIQRQDRAAISVLFERYGHLVFGICLSHFRSPETAKDATQAIFLQMMEDLFRFKADHFKSWLLLYTRNYCLAKHGSLKQQPAYGEDTWADYDREIKDKLDKRELEGQIKPALATLDKQQRESLELFYKEQLTFAQIATRTKHAVSDVRKLLRDGKLNLRNKLYNIAEVRK